MLNIIIPDTVEEAIKLPEAKKKRELLKLLALKLYEKGFLGIGKAAEMCGLTKFEFMSLLKEEGMFLNYDEEELEKDLENLELFK